MKRSGLFDAIMPMRAMAFLASPIHSILFFFPILNFEVTFGVKKVLYKSNLLLYKHHATPSLIYIKSS